MARVISFRIFGCHFLLYTRGRCNRYVFQPFVTVAFTDKGRLDGCAYRFSRIICHDIDDTVIGYFTKFAFHLLRLDIETGKQRAVFSERLVTVGTEYALDDIGYLFLHVTALVVRFFEIRFQQFLPLVFHLFQAELPFQFPAGFHRAVPLVGIVNLFPFLVHASGYDMDVPAADVLVYIYDVGLVAISHLLHILFGEVGKLAVCQPVIQ